MRPPLVPGSYLKLGLEYTEAVSAHCWFGVPPVHLAGLLQFMENVLVASFYMEREHVPTVAGHFCSGGGGGSGG